MAVVLWDPVCMVGRRIYRGVGSVRQRTFRTRIESPDFLDLCCGNTALTLLPGGIPYHTVIEPGQIDTLLIPPGESSRQFTWKLGLGLSAPAETAWSAFVDPIFCSATRQAVAPPSAWVLHVSDPKVIVTHVEFVAVEQGTRIRLRCSRLVVAVADFPFAASDPLRQPVN